VYNGTDIEPDIVE